MRRTPTFFCAAVLLVAFSLGSAGCKRTVATRPASSLSAADHLVLDDYEKLRAALVSDDYKISKRTAAKMAADLKGEPDKGPVSPLAPAAQAVADANAMDLMRQHFQILSQQVVPLAQGVEGYYIMTSSLPSAGDWVQRSPEVDNPYFGRAMRSAGEIKK